MRERTNEQVKKSYVHCKLLRIFITSEQAFSLALGQERLFARARQSTRSRATRACERSARGLAFLISAKPR